MSRYKHQKQQQRAFKSQNKRQSNAVPNQDDHQNIKDSRYEQVQSESSSDRPEPSPVWERLPDLLCILGDTSSITGHLECLSWQTTSHIGGFDSGEQRNVGELIDMLLPRHGGLLGGVDILELLALNLLDGVDDPAALDLDRGRSVGEEGGALWSIEMEHVGVAGDGCAEVGVGCGFPFVFDVGSVDALEAHVGLPFLLVDSFTSTRKGVVRAYHAARGDVVASSDGNDIELVDFPISSLNAGFGEFLDRSLVYVDNVDVLAVELLVVVLLQARSLDAPVVRRLEGREQIAFLRVLDSSAYLLAPVVVHLKTERSTSDCAESSMAD